MLPRPLSGWDGTGKFNQENFSWTKVRDFFIANTLLDVVRAVEAKPEPKKATSGWNRRDHLLLWSYDKLANGISRVWVQRRLLFLSPHTLFHPPPLSSIPSQVTSSGSGSRSLGTWRSHDTLSGIPQNSIWSSLCLHLIASFWLFQDALARGSP